ncbi:MAG: Holliday junction resolvase RuvX [Aestuariivita sp.]|nr:Holliday junction resolvase RuvX [Aestuariivita sp.]
MITNDVLEFHKSVEKNKTLIGMDLGSKTIGIAVSDRNWRIASPLETIHRTKFSRDIEHLLSIIQSRFSGGLVLGLPLNMDGSEGPRCQSTRTFARNLTKFTNLPITFWDERLSTVASERLLSETETSPKRQPKHIDHIAASFILQGLIDRLNYHEKASQNDKKNMAT